MGLTGFNRARREAAAKIENEQPTDRGPMVDASAAPALNTTGTTDGTMPAGSATMDTAGAAKEGSDSTAPAAAKPAAKKPKAK